MSSLSTFRCLTPEVHPRVSAGDTVDIFEYTEFEFYDLIVYWDDRDNETRQSIGRWLGLSHIGSALCYYLLTEKATILSRTSLQHITKEDFETDEMRERVRVYHEELNRNINAVSEYLNEEDGDDFITDDVVLPIGYQENEGGYFGLENMPDIDEVIESENARVEAGSYDKFVGVDVILPNSADQKLMARVINWNLCDVYNSSGIDVLFVVVLLLFYIIYCCVG